MNLIPLSFILSGLLALPAAAAGLSPAPALVRLDQALTQTLAQKAHGELAPEQVATLSARYRTDLAAAKADAPPTTENIALHARLLQRLSELDPAAANVGAASRSADLSSEASRKRFDEKTTPAVLTTEKRILSGAAFRESCGAQDFVTPSGTHRRFRFAARRAATSLLANLPIPPAPASDDSSSTPAQAAGLAALAAAGAMLLLGGLGGGELE